MIVVEETIVNAIANIDSLIIISSGRFPLEIDNDCCNRAFLC